MSNVYKPICLFLATKKEEIVECATKEAHQTIGWGRPWVRVCLHCLQCLMITCDVVWWMIISIYYNIKCVGDEKIPYMTGDKNCFTWKETKITVSGTKRRHPIGSSSQFLEESLTHRGVLCPPFFSALQVEGISMGNQRRCNSRACRVNDEDQLMCGFAFSS